MSSIGRLPTPASARIGLTGSAADDDELELLNLQLSATSNAPRSVGVGCFSMSITKAHFSTHPRKRQKQRSLMTLWYDRQLLDEIQSEGIRHLLARVQFQWDFSAFSLDRLSNGSNLPTLCTYLFKQHNLISHFRLDSLTTWKFFALVERGYHSTNPYHNSAHAADVTQAMACFIIEPSIIKYLTPCEIMAALIGAVCHDIDHPGLNEKFLIASSSHLAGLYGNASVLENHHWKSAISILWESGFAKMLRDDDRLEMEGIIKELILATDISRQPEFLSLLRQYQDTGDMDLSLTRYRHFVLQIALKCADISNPCRSWNISRLWSYRACEEFFRQGDRERDLGMPVTQVCDRQNISIAKVQSGFYRFIAAPLFEEWNRFLSSPLSRQMLNNLTSNQARWDLIIQQETARSASMAESVVSQFSSSSSSGGGSIVGGDTSRRESLDPHVSHQRLSRSSADGDDDSDPCASYPYMQFEYNVPHRTNLATTMCSRRHSLPVQTESFVRLFTTTMEPNIDESSSVLPPNGPTVRHPSVPSASPMIVPQFIRQHSFGERRRSLKQPQLVGADPHYVTSTMRACNRRRLFAGNRSPMISTVESLSSSGSSHSGSAVEVEKSASSSFEQDSALKFAEENYEDIDQHFGKANTLDNRKCVPNMSVDNATSNNITSKQLGLEITNTISKSACANQNQHRSVTFQVSGSSDSSSENSKDDFQLDLEQCQKLVTNMQRNLSNKENINSSRRGSAPCNLLLNQINANKLALAAKAGSSNKDYTQNEIPVLPFNYIINDNDNVSNSYRRGSLPVDLTSFNVSNNVMKNNSILQTSAFENKNSTNREDSLSCANREDRLSYAAKRRQMVHCKKILDKNHSVDIGTVSSSCRPPMLSRCSSLRSSSFGGVGGHANNNNFVPIEVSSVHLDNYTSSFPLINSQSIKNRNDNLEAFSNKLMCRRGSAPIHRQSSLSHVPGKGCSLASSDDGARDHIHVVQSRVQALQNGSSGYYCNSNASTNSNSVNNPQTLLNEVVNNCINNGNTSDNNSANIRRGSLPTDFHFYNDFGVC